MRSFVKTPNLPDRAVGVILGEKYAARFHMALADIGVTPIYLPDNPCVSPGLSGHADLSVFHCGGSEVLIAPYLAGSDFAESFEGLGCKVTAVEVQQGSAYPKDCVLNACVVGKWLLCNPDITALEVLSRFENESVIGFKQGYARCTVCVVDENSIITADPGIAAAAEGRGLDVLKIQPGFFELPGYSYGFIGGSCFKLSRTELAFTGTIDRHPDRGAIIGFLRNHGVEPMYLTDEPAVDIGGMIPIFEQ